MDRKERHVYKTVIFNYCIRNIEMWLESWWKVSSVNPSLGYMVRLVLKLITGEQILVCNAARWTKETPICKLCDVYTTESVWHFLFDCINVNLGVVQEEMLKTIYDVMPTPMQIYLTNLTSKENTCYLLSGMAKQILCNIIFLLYNV